MPRAPAFKIDAIADLLRQLEYAPAETRRRQMDAAERLAGEIDPDIVYPGAFVIYRITGYRPDDDDLTSFSGAALRQDLANLVQRVSDALSLPARRNGQAALTMEQVATRLNVSPKTVQRYRRDGLVCHYVERAEGEKQLACYADALERFAESRQSRLRRAADFARMDDATVAEVIEQARRLRAERRLTLNAAAKQIARERGRAHETIRQTLLRHDRSASEPIFHERGPLHEREARIMHRAWLRGVDLGVMAQHFGRSRASMHRVITRRRASMLRGLRLTHVALPTFELEGAGSVILSPAVVCRDLPVVDARADALRLIDASMNETELDEPSEDALLAGWNYLKMRAAAGIARLNDDDAPGSDAIDQIETDLRWASLLHRRLALAALPAALRRIEFNLGRGLVTQPSEQIVVLLTTAMGVIREALEGVDPSRGQRIERVTAFAMERELAARGGLAAAGARAAARHVPGTVPLGPSFMIMDEWEPSLDPWRSMGERVVGLNGEWRDVLTWRYGWSGEPPRTVRGIAMKMGARPPRAARTLQRAIRELRARWRDEA